MKRKVDYEKAWKMLRKWLWNAHNVDGWTMYTKMTEILKRCTEPQKKRAEEIIDFKGRQR